MTLTYPGIATQFVVPADPTTSNVERQSQGLAGGWQMELASQRRTRVNGPCDRHLHLADAAWLISIMQITRGSQGVIIVPAVAPPNVNSKRNFKELIAKQISHFGLLRQRVEVANISACKEKNSNQGRG